MATTPHALPSVTSAPLPWLKALIPSMPRCRQFASPLSPALIACTTLLTLAALTHQPLRADQPAGASLSSPSTPTDPPAPSTPSALNLLTLLRHHLDTAPAAPIPADILPATQGLCIIIRAPRDLGANVAANPANNLNASPASDLLAVISTLAPNEPPSQALTAAVLNRALDQARARLTTRLANQPPSPDATPSDLRAAKAIELLRLCTITLEIPRDITPLAVDRLESLDLRYKPLTQGFAVTTQPDPTAPQTAAVFPLEMMLAGLTPSAAASRALAESTGNPQAPFKPLASLTPAPAFVTFQTSQATELASATPVSMLLGQIPLPQATIDSAEELTALITSLAQALESLVNNQPGPIPEEIDLATGRITQSQDPHRQAASEALMLLALQRASRTLALEQTSDLARNLTRAEAALTARLDLYLLEQAAQSKLTPPPQPPPSSTPAPSPRPAATNPASPLQLLPAALYLLSEAPAPSTRAAAINLITPYASKFTAPAAAAAIDLTAADGLILSALLRAGLISPSAAASCLLSAPPPLSTQSLIRTAPWSFWLLLGPAKDTLTGDARQSLAAARDALTRLQARFLTDTPNPSDLGGLLLPLTPSPRLDPQSPLPAQPAPDASSPLRAPTWRTLALTAALPSFAFDRALTPASKHGELLVSSLSAMRYLRQLQVDPLSAWYAQDPANHQGLVRLATWETRASIDATSMSLLAACDTLAAARYLTAPPKITPPAPASSIPSPAP